MRILVVIGLVIIFSVAYLTIAFKEGEYNLQQFWNVEGFRAKEAEVLYKKCPEKYVVSGVDTCCPEGDYKNGACVSSECTTDCNKWMTMPVCKQSTRGIISEYGRLEPKETCGEETFVGNSVPLSYNEMQATAGNSLPLELNGDGLPATQLQLVKPKPNIKMYDGRLIAPEGDDSFAVYVRDNKVYLVQPPNVFANYEQVLLKIPRDEYSSMGTTVPQTGSGQSYFPRIQAQSWYQTSSTMNPFYKYEGNILVRETTQTTQTTQTQQKQALSFIKGGVQYVFWSTDCSPNIKITTINKGDPVFSLLPTGNTFHRFRSAAKEPWFKSLLPDCKTI